MLKQLNISILFCSISFLSQGCSSGSGGGFVAAGGAQTGGALVTTGGAVTGGVMAAAGGAAAAGGSPAVMGGSAATGGASSGTGGAVMGGTTSAGGATTAGGTLALGGTIVTGGAKSGGATAAGGAAAGGTAAGGSATGGSKAGGTMAAGGSSATAGAKTGGAPGTGGTPSSGGSTTPANPGAPETKPLGYGQATTGGGATTPVTADSMAAVQAAIDAYSGSGGLVINYTGKFDFTSITDPCTQWLLPAQTVEIKKTNDITILGADGSAAHFGFHIASSSSNIIIRNMTIGLLAGAGAADAISIEGMSGGFPTNIWIDHNELFSSMVECPGAGDTSFDGLIDIKKGADNITVSYNYLHDHRKVSLNGFSDDDTAVRHITFHHNVFSNVGSRTPLQRGGYSHVLNNYLTTITTSGVNVRMSGYSLVEGNYFEKAENPVTSRDSSALGFWELRNNNVMTPADFATYTITWSASTSTPTKDATDWTTTAAYPVALGYTYSVDPPQCLKDNLLGVAGAGKGLATLKCN